MKKNFIIILTFITSIAAFSQGEANIWYFGENAGLNFNNCSPFAITDGELDTVEGCSTFSDPNGNLLFYSDGITVWNRNHDIMPNGNDLLGNPSSSQSAMIIPKPGSNSIYYIFTVGAEGGGSESGFNYYVIDMNEDSGFGDIVEGPIDLSQGQGHNWSEKVAAVKGAENGTFWVLSYVPNEFVAYKVTSDGVATNPIITPSFAANDKRGYLKISPDGTKVAVAHQSDGAFLVYDFNDVTGKTSNEIELPLITEGNKPYGVEFSANSEKLYVHASNDAFIAFSDENPTDPIHMSTLFQFDVSLSSDTDIINSRTIIHEGILFRGSLQLGPDRKIYRSLARSYTEGIPQLGVIENPDNDGLACNYNHASVGLIGRLSTQGLPPFIASIFSQVQIIAEGSNGEQTNINNGEAVSLCAGDDISLFSETLTGTATYSWNLNGSEISTDPILELNNITTASNGDYSVSVLHIDLCGNPNTLTSEFTVEVLDNPIVLSPFDLYNCDEDGIPDGFTDFNLDQANDAITIGDTDLTVTYHLTLDNASTETGAINPLPFNNTIANTVYARVENAAGCHSVSIVNLNVSTTAFPIGYSGETISTCDDDDLNDGLSLFDLSPLSSTFLSQFPPNPNLSVHYYRNVSDAQLELNEISQGELYMSETPFSQIIYVRIENDLDGSCFGIGPYLTLTVYPRPEFDVNPEAIICVNYTNFTVLQTFNPQGMYTYGWTGPNGFTSNLPTVTVFSGGQYTVTASITALNGDICESFVKTVDVIESNIADIDLDDISITDDSANNSITINNSNNNLGIGDYEFSLGYEFGPYQDSPIFENVDIGIHTIYINDKNGCGVSSIEVSVIGFPKFFTPNNDGVNDTWIILGVNQTFYSQTTVEIFNRFGKILAIIKPSSQGWDGLYNGIKLPESDYWFKAKIVDDEGNIRNRKGHFSLIRRVSE
jgi:gliding motility-associated-like protein